MRGSTAFLAAAVAAVGHARIHHLVIKDDTRFAFSIESFGFLDKGEMTIQPSQISAEPAGSRVGEGALASRREEEKPPPRQGRLFAAAGPHRAPRRPRAGFVLFPAVSDSSVSADIDAVVGKGDVRAAACARCSFFSRGRPRLAFTAPSRLSLAAAVRPGRARRQLHLRHGDPAGKLGQGGENHADGGGRCVPAPCPLLRARFSPVLVPCPRSPLIPHRRHV